MNAARFAGLSQIRVRGRWYRAVDPYLKQSSVNLILVNFLAAAILGVLVWRGHLSLYAATLLGWGTIFPLTTLLALYHSRSRISSPAREAKIPARVWVGSSVLFTWVAISAVLNMVRRPDLPALEVVGLIVLVGCILFIVRMISHIRR